MEMIRRLFVSLSQVLSSSASTLAMATPLSGRGLLKISWAGSSSCFHLSHLDAGLVFVLHSCALTRQGRVAAEEASDLSHRRSELQTRERAVRHGQNQTGAQQGEFVSLTCDYLFSAQVSNNKLGLIFTFFFPVSLKAYCGFMGKDGDPEIATGKWGCGAFKGDPQLKGGS